VPKIWIGTVAAASPRNSRSAMAREYVSSPPEHPAIHRRTGVSGARERMSSGKPVSLRPAKTSGSRKKLVTPIRRSS